VAAASRCRHRRRCREGSQCSLRTTWLATHLIRPAAEEADPGPAPGLPVPPTWLRERLAERGSAVDEAPHIGTPMRFILPHRPHLRPALVRAGRYLTTTSGASSRDRAACVLVAWRPLQAEISRECHADCYQVDDIPGGHSVMPWPARDRGARIHPHPRGRTPQQGNVAYPSI
jgi:hypothetical protein